jgi:hypothetical protein
MDLEQLVRRAAQGDVKAYVALTQRFQHFAFGSALALVGDFHQAEDVVQEAFVAAWAALPSLAEPAAFAGSSGGSAERPRQVNVLQEGAHFSTPVPAGSQLSTHSRSFRSFR